ncbi:MAG: WcaI family glycosyltransferase [Roseiarcus sp.]
MAKIVIYGMNYAPEFAGVGRYTGEIGDHLSQIGHDVTVITTPPHYPGWKAIPPYRNRGYSVELKNRVRILRCPLLLRERMHGIWRVLAPLSFAVASAPVAFWQIVGRRPRTVLCVEPTLLVAPVALLAASIVGATTVLHVHDLEVDAAFGVGHLGGARWIRMIAYGFERAMLRRFRRVVTISNKMAERLVAKGVDRGRISVVRNWVDLECVRPLEGISPFRAELGIGPEDFVVLYSGALGAKQGLDHLMAAILEVNAQSNIQFVIAGEGPAKAKLAAELGEVANVRLLPFQPEERLSDFLGLADLHVLPQQSGAADLVLPSKMGGMLASGRRIVVTAAIGTELALFLDGAAIVVAPDDPGALADAILRSAADESFGPLISGRGRQLAQLLSKVEALRSIEVAILGTEESARGEAIVVRVAAAPP